METQKSRVKAREGWVMMLHRQGWSCRAIGKALHMDKKTVKRVLVDRGVVFEDPRWSREKIQQMLDMRADGMKQHEIADAFGVSRSAVNAKLRVEYNGGSNDWKPKRYRPGEEPECCVERCDRPALIYRGSPYCAEHTDEHLEAREVA